MIKVKCEGAELVALEKLVIIQNNLKELSTENYEMLKNEILNDGFKFPIEAWKDNGVYKIINGTHRKKVLDQLKKEGHKIPKIPVSIIHADNLQDAIKSILSSTSSYAKIDSQGLYELMSEYDIDPNELNERWDFNDNWTKDAFMNEFFFDDIEQLPSEGEDDVPEVKHDPVTKHGDIWLLGEHRLMNGDSTMIDDVEKLMKGEKADMVFTDPPYGYKYESNYQNKHEMLKNDDKILDFLPVARVFMAENSTIYLCTSHQVVDQWKPRLEEVVNYKNMVIWKKNNWSMGDLKGSFAGQHEIILFGSNGKSNIIGKRETDIWEFKRTPPELHPTMKPVELIEYALSKWQSGKVLDLFLGSGSTLIACEKTNRKCYGMELDEHYCDVIINRWQDFTGKDAILESTGERYSDLLRSRDDK